MQPGGDSSNAVAPAAAEGPYGPGNQLDLNRATLEELISLPLDEDLAREAMRKAGHKLPVKTRFVKREEL